MNKPNDLPIRLHRTDERVIKHMKINQKREGDSVCVSTFGVNGIGPQQLNY